MNFNHICSFHFAKGTKLCFAKMSVKVYLMKSSLKLMHLGRIITIDNYSTKYLRNLFEKSIFTFFLTEAFLLGEKD